MCYVADDLGMTEVNWGGESHEPRDHSAGSDATDHGAQAEALIEEALARAQEQSTGSTTSDNVAQAEKDEVARWVEVVKPPEPGPEPKDDDGERPGEGEDFGGEGEDSGGEGFDREASAQA